MEGALDEALAGEEAARDCAEELEETLRQRVEAEHRVPRNLGIGPGSEEGEDADESVRRTDDSRSVEKEEPLRVGDDAFQGEGDVEVDAAQSPENSFLAVENTHHEEVSPGPYSESVTNLVRILALTKAAWSKKALASGEV